MTWLGMDATQLCSILLLHFIGGLSHCTVPRSCPAPHCTALYIALWCSCAILQCNHRLQTSWCCTLLTYERGKGVKFCVRVSVADKTACVHE